MTGRRKSSRRSGGSSSSKNEIVSPEKTRKSTRRRAQKKSDSEPEDETGSERSVPVPEELPKDDPKKVNNDTSKEDESAGSDGSWQVRSENGNKGGIPKLKISLHRPPETSSPTSEPLSSPKLRRSRRGAANDEGNEDGDIDVNEGNENEAHSSLSDSKIHETDSSRSKVLEKRAEQEKLRREELAKEKKQQEEEEQRKADEEEKKRLAEEAKAAAIQKAKEEKEVADRKAKEEKLKAIEEKKAAERKAEEERQARRLSEEAKETKRREQEREARRKSREEKEAIQRAEEEKLARKKSREEKEAKEAEEKIKAAGEEEERKKSEEAKRDGEEMKIKPGDKKGAEGDSSVIAHVKDKKLENARDTRSASRDSSEERAKQAALASRKQKRKDGSEDGEVVDSSETEVVFPVRSEGRFKTSTLSNDDSKENKDHMPVVRKRRWGSSGSQGPKKPLAISTDILKEIIPEVKPVSVDEVELSQDNDDIKEVPVDTRAEGRDDSHSRFNRRRRSVPSDESEKDYEEEGVESGGEEMVKKEPPPANHVSGNDCEIQEIGRKSPERKAAPVDPLEAIAKQRSPSPARHPPSCVLYITNLVRPFTVVQLRDLLARTGTIVEDKGFWIDAIKSRCYVKYTSEEDAKATRHALHRVRWPASNPKELNVDFGTEEAMKVALEGGRAIVGDGERRVAVEERREREREREAREVERKREREERPRRDVEVKGLMADKEEKEVRRVVERAERDRDRGKERDREREEKPSRTVRKVTVPIREWDLGKAEKGFSPPPPDRHHGEREDRRKRVNERSSSVEPGRKVRKTSEEPAPKPLLDELFRKTKAVPSIYWLPLTTQEIAEKEAQRLKHMEEHQKRIAEEKKRHEIKRRRSSRSRSRSPKK